ncbi:unnamed product [Ostreococcus tauri]|uniref:Unnamed product n=2 Tax=Ostreococcus tauri TaxID=70448 RepID=A0A096PAZ9_OSTTA|nr:unnamed product [Ostreococcus tauri]CEG02129.1 unnamed product [Ostreococcus tauri]|eukprot:XP_003083045.2 unnamed product [Ostreococcus tauri]
MDDAVKPRAPVQPMRMIRDAHTGVDRDPTYAEAVTYARALPNGATSDDFTGLHKCRGGDACSGCFRPLCAVCPICAYNCPCGAGCTDVIWCLWGIPIPLFSCVTACACREGDESGAFIARDKQQMKSCALVPLDPNSGRYAVYFAEGCEGCDRVFREDARPACVAEPLFGASNAIQI